MIPEGHPFRESVIDGLILEMRYYCDINLSWRFHIVRNNGCREYYSFFDYDNDHGQQHMDQKVDNPLMRYEKKEIISIGRSW